MRRGFLRGILLAPAVVGLLFVGLGFLIAINAEAKLNACGPSCSPIPKVWNTTQRDDGLLLGWVGVGLVSVSFIAITVLRLRESRMAASSRGSPPL